jgi:hypothetical protein
VRFALERRLCVLAWYTCDGGLCFLFASESNLFLVFVLTLCRFCYAHDQAAMTQARFWRIYVLIGRLGVQNVVSLVLA